MLCYAGEKAVSFNPAQGRQNKRRFIDSSEREPQVEVSLLWEGKIDLVTQPFTGYLLSAYCWGMSWVERRSLLESPH